MAKSHFRVIRVPFSILKTFFKPTLSLALSTISMIALAVDDFSVISTINIPGSGHKTKFELDSLADGNGNGRASINAGNAPIPFIFAESEAFCACANLDLLSAGNVQLSYFVKVNGAPNSDVKVRLHANGTASIAVGEDVARVTLTLTNLSASIPLLRKEICLDDRLDAGLQRLCPDYGGNPQLLPPGYIWSYSEGNHGAFLTSFDTNESFTVKANTTLAVGMQVLTNSRGPVGNAQASLDSLVVLDPSNANPGGIAPSLEFSKNLLAATPSTAVTQKQANCLFDWAEDAFGSYFSPKRSSSQIMDVYYYRYYSQSASYLGLSNADLHLYYLASGSPNPLDLGLALRWVNRAGCN